MSRKLNALVCVAHPDDETIFFGGLILSKNYNWTVVCATDANADGLGAERMRQFKRSCQALGVKNIVTLNFIDKFRKRIPIKKLIIELQKLGDFDEVYTHGILGEYGHIQHQDVSFAVHQVFASSTKVFSVAYNIYPKLHVLLTEKQFKIKTDILWKIYSGESLRFLSLLPATFSEGFCQISISEIKEIYEYVLGKKKLNKKNLEHYAWLATYIEKRDYELKFRPF